jgi:hypothetical protein
VAGGAVVGGTVVGGAVVGGTVVAVGGFVVVVGGGAVVVVVGAVVAVGAVVVVVEWAADRTVVDERGVVVVDEWPAVGFVPPAHDAVPMAMTNSPRTMAAVGRTRFSRASAGRSTDISPPLVVPPWLA